MDNITITENPYNEQVNINPDVEYKVAKLKNDTKRVAIEAFWKKELSKMKEKNVVTALDASQNSDADILSRLDMTCLDYYANSTLQGARKLKANKMVIDKTNNFYKKYNPKCINNHEEVKEEVYTPSSSNMSSVPQDTRMSRLERTGEIPKVDESQVTLRREDLHSSVEYEKPNNIVNTPVINAPNRFIEKKEEISPVNEISRTEMGTVNQEEVKKDPEMARGGDPNLYNKLIHGENENETSISSQLREAKEELLTANEEKARAQEVNRGLEREKAELLATIQKIKKEQEEKAQVELEDTKMQIKNTKDEILSETRKYDNLQSEIARLMQEKDALLSSTRSRTV